jgi:RHH-type proline utilization regulon transcriptional repressor/proline dehydrogenase/delta 1-pyrroline-5-carboxylate dehydrogenase
MSNFTNSPYTDFSKKQNLDWIRDGIPELRKKLPIHAKPIINGLTLNGSETRGVSNPSSKKEIVTILHLSSIELADKALVSCEKGFPNWKNTAPVRRAEIIEEIGHLISKSRREFISLLALEVGKNARESDAEVAEAIDFCNYYASEAKRIFNEYHADIDGEENRTKLIPYGIGLVLAPWNFPLAILCGMTVGLLVTGNVVIVKPAEQSSGIASLLFALFLKAGIPADAVQFLPGEGELIGDYLAKHEKVKLINFTGSKKVGLDLLKIGTNIKPNQFSIKKVLCEMGGKNAIIIDSDADLDEAIVGCIQSAFGFQGQKCSALSRIIVLEDNFAKFLERFRDRLASFSIGPVESQESQIGPLIDADSKFRLESLIEKHKAEIYFKAEISNETKEAGYFVAPTIFISNDPDSELGQMEFFGPAVCVFRANDLHEAIQIFNQTDYALTGGIYSRNPESIELAKQELDVGNLFINRTITGSIVARQPFGGHKLSGVGYKAGGQNYLIQFLKEKTISENTVRRGFSK